MNQALNHWLNTMRQDLEVSGIKATVVDGQQENSYGINLDSKKFVGGVFYWPENTYEVQFNDCSSGEVIFLETVNFDEPKVLEKYLNQVVFKRLSGEIQ
jgi:hypothetical protein